MKSEFLLAFCFILLMDFRGLAQDVEPIATDRPDQTESSSLVPKGYFQLETGLAYEQESPLLQNYTYNTSLWKYGLSNNFELRLITEYLGSREALVGSETSDHGLGPIAIGSKIALCNEKGWIPEISLISHLTLRFTGKKDYRPSHTAPDFRFAISHGIGERASWGVNLGAEWDGVSPNATGIYTLALAYSLAENLGMFIETYGFVTEDAPADHRFDGGFTYLIGNNFQLDTSAGVGLSKVSPDYFLSIGASIRLPK